jgi:hypothetical protein
MIDQELLKLFDEVVVPACRKATGYTRKLYCKILTDSTFKKIVKSGEEIPERTVLITDEGWVLCALPKFQKDCTRCPVFKQGRKK